MTRPPRHSEAETVILKSELIARVENGTMVTYAMRELGISRDEIAWWRATDPAFKQDITDAQEHQTECELDRLKNLHEELPDAKIAQVASNNTRYWLEQRNHKFRPKAEPRDDQPQLVDILRAAVNRLIESVPPAPQLPPPIDITPERPFRSEQDPNDRHQP